MVITALIMFVVLASALSILAVEGLRSSSTISEAKQFVSYVHSVSERMHLDLVAWDWNADANMVSLHFRNGGSAIDVNTLVFFLNGVRVGACGEVSCEDVRSDGVLSPGEDIFVRIPDNAPPYRVSVTGGPFGVVLLSTELNNWLTGCKYRLLVRVDNPSSVNLHAFQVPVDLSGLDYASSDANAVAVTLVDGITEIPFWVEYWNVGGRSRVWLPIDVAAGDTNYVFIYYGCVSLRSYSPSKVFVKDVSDLTAYWPFDDNTTVVYDLSGNGYDMNAVGISWVSGVRGLAAHFSGGTDSYALRYPFNGFPSDEITVIMFVDTNTTQAGGILSYAVGTNPYDNEFLLYNPTNLRVYKTTTSYSYRTTGIALNDGAWHWLAVLWRASDGNLLVYLDGSVAYVASTPLATGYPIRDGGSLVFGQEQDSVAGGFDATQSYIGALDDVLLFSRYLDADELRAIYDNNYFVSPYYPSHLLVRQWDPGVYVSVVRQDVYSAIGKQ